MKTILKISAIAIVLGSMLMADVPFIPVQLVPEAQAIFGVRRRTAVVASSAAHAEDAAAVSQANQQAAAAATPAPPAAAAGQPLPVGTVVSALPKGCVSTPVGGVEYYYCAGNFYRAVFQGNQLVYVTAQPK
jgi:hypothetical protein